jgi:hypothetical protein
MFAMLTSRPRATWPGLVALALLTGIASVTASGCGDTAPAQPDAGPLDPLGLHDWASAVVLGSGSRWVGERLPEHAPDPRPSPSLRAESERFALGIHAPPSVAADAVTRTLRGAEAMAALLEQEGWPAAVPDGGRGGTPGVDVYLVPGLAADSTPGAGPRPAAGSDEGLPGRAGFDERALHTFLDRASTFARLSPWLAAADLESCAGVAYAEARLLSVDPAEAESWRRATAAYLAHRLWGRWGCEDEALLAQQHTAEAFVAYADEPPSAGGALLLTALAERHEARAGEFVASLWDLASQRTWEARRTSGKRSRPCCGSAKTPLARPSRLSPWTASWPGRAAPRRAPRGCGRSEQRRRRRPAGSSLPAPCAPTCHPQAS